MTGNPATQSRLPRKILMPLHYLHITDGASGQPAHHCSTLHVAGCTLQVRGVL